MNLSKIEYCDYTLNFITGCQNTCEYCYARRMSHRFSGNVKLNVKETSKYSEHNGLFVLDRPFMGDNDKQIIYPFGFKPTLHRYRFSILDNLKTGRNIFVGAMADMFGDWVPDEWITEVFEKCMEHEQHNYLFLTKNPERYADLELLPEGENMFYGTTITQEGEMHRFNFLPAFRNTFVSMEPLLEDLKPEQHNLLFRQVDWIILGAETGNRKGKVVPNPDWIRKIVEMADREHTPVFMKDSLLSIVGEKNLRRDFPGQLRIHKKSQKVLDKIMGTCMLCGNIARKNEMISLMARAGRGGKSSSFAYMCKLCFGDWCREYGLNAPQLNEKK